MSFIAAFTSGTCGSCNGPISEGQEVEYDLSDRLVHVDCQWPSLDLLDRQVSTDHINLDDPAPYGICDRCFLTLPASGVCGSC